MSNKVQAHYGSDGIVTRVFAAIPYTPDSGIKLSASDMFRFDQLHGRELQATIDHLALLKPDAESYILDIGSGIGGPARYMAQTFGARVAGIDITPEFVGAARALTKACGLDGLVSFALCDASSMPFKDVIFDGAVCFYVGMNLADKAGVLKEAHRVLRQGGKLVWTEAVQVSDAPPYYPLPWAKESTSSFLNTAPQLRAMIEGAGFRVVAETDESAKHIELAMRMKASGAIPPPAVIELNKIVLGDGFVERRANYIRSLADKRIASLVFETVKA